MWKSLSSVASVGTFVVVVLAAPAYDAAHGNWPGRHLRQPIPFESIRSGATAKQIEADLKQHTQLDDVVRPRYNEARFLLTGVTNPGVAVGPNDWLFLAQRIGEPGQEARNAIPIIAAAAAAIDRFLAVQGCELTIALAPRKETLFPEETPKGTAKPYVPMYQVVLDALREAGLDVLDLRAPLAGREPLLWLTNDAHWTSEGCHVAGRVIADHLKAQFPAGVPGPPIVSEFHRYPPEPFVGYEQRLLAFTRDGWLDRRFSTTHTWVRATMPGHPGHQYNGAKEPRPILLIGTSMSMQPYGLASQLIGWLGVEVENHSKDGFSAGYRVVEKLRLFLTGRQPYPEAIVWEIPEDFISREGRYVYQPLWSLVDAFEHAPYRVEPIPVEALQLDDLEGVQYKDGRLEARTRSAGASVCCTLPVPVAGGAGAILAFEATLPTGSPRHSGTLTVEWGDDPAAAPLGSKELNLRISHWQHPVLIPLRAGPDQLVRYVRVRPFNVPTPLQIGNFEQWLSVEGK